MSRFASALLVHGAGGGGWEWNLWRGAFDVAGIAVAAPDLQPAPGGLAGTTLADYAAQVRAALEALPRPRAVVGASLGGLLALQAAALADAAVLVNPLPPSPWHAGLPRRHWPGVVPWRRTARLPGTRRALPESDDATALHAFRGWRDESGPVLRAAHGGVAVERPGCPLLCVLSRHDEDVPVEAVAAMADEWGATVLRAPSDSHLGPLLGRQAATVAAQAVAWLNRPRDAD